MAQPNLSENGNTIKKEWRVDELESFATCLKFHRNGEGRQEKKFPARAPETTRGGETEQHKSWTALRGLCAPPKAAYDLGSPRRSVTQGLTCRHNYTTWPRWRRYLPFKAIFVTRSCARFSRAAWELSMRPNSMA